MQQNMILEKITVHGTKEIVLSNGKRLCYLVECKNCHLLHYKAQCELLKSIRRNKNLFCSMKCYGSFNSGLLTVNCKNCTKLFHKKPSEINKTKNNFCCKSCAATFNNKNKTYGTRRSKLEKLIETNILKYFPKLNFICNDKIAIGSELDFYFPDKNLAIQINGILHFQPIYGEKKLSRIQELDQEKRKICQEKHIRLFELNCQNDKYLNKKIQNLRWEEIREILAEEVGTDPNTHN